MFQPQGFKLQSTAHREHLKSKDLVGSIANNGIFHLIKKEAPLSRGALSFAHAIVVVNFGLAFPVAVQRGIFGLVVVLIRAVTRTREGVTVSLRIGAETVLEIDIFVFVGGVVVNRLEVVDDRIKLRRVHRVRSKAQRGENEGGFGGGESEVDLIHGRESKRILVRVKKKVKEKKGRSERPRIHQRGEAIPREIDFFVDGVDHREPSVKLGAVSVGQAGIIGGGIGGEGVDQVHAIQNETFFGAVKLFFEIFYFFSRSSPMPTREKTTVSRHFF